MISWKTCYFLPMKYAIERKSDGFQLQFSNKLFFNFPRQNISFSTVLNTGIPLVYYPSSPRGGH